MTKYPFSAVLLAAGTSSRMEGNFKQLLPLPTPTGDEEPVVRTTTRALLAAEPEEVVVVTGHRGREVMKALADLPISFAPNPLADRGWATQQTDTAPFVGAHETYDLRVHNRDFAQVNNCPFHAVTYFTLYQFQISRSNSPD